MLLNPRYGYRYHELPDATWIQIIHEGAVTVP
jgi:hypothetical protein